MDALFAVRYKQYKGNYFTTGVPLYSGMSHPNSHPDCYAPLSAEHLPPLLHDLSQDPAELIQLNPEQNQEVVRKLQQIKEKAESDMMWTTSELQKPSIDEYMPCCTPGCEPFPSCCQCSHGNGGNDVIQPANKKKKVQKSYRTASRLTHWFMNTG